MIRTYYNAKIRKSVYISEIKTNRHRLRNQCLFVYYPMLIGFGQNAYANRPISDYCFQNPGNRIVSTVNISRRPTIIRNDRNHFDTVGTSA